MNERVMQFRIGMFVIVAGMVLAMLIVWFGESPQLLRDHVFIRVHFAEAPGVAEGTPVRKSGIRIGQVSSIVFDERPDQPDGVLVTLSLEKRYHLRKGSVPRISRSLMGDVSIDMQPGTSPGLLAAGKNPASAPIIQGTVAPDPAKALAAATLAFEKAGETLNTIDEAFTGLSKITKSADDIGPFLKTWSDAGKKMSTAADTLNRLVQDNEGNIEPTITSMRQTSETLNKTFDLETQIALKRGIAQFASASARLDSGLADAGPLFRDLGASVRSNPQTDLGQAARRMNLISSDLSLLTQTLRAPDGKLNTNGTIQMLLMKRDVYDNISKMSATFNDTFLGLKPVVSYFRVFAKKIADDPSTLARGALQRE